MKKLILHLTASMVLMASAAAWGLPPNTVWVRVTVDAAGAVSNTELVQNTGTPDMAAAAMRKLRTLHYKPAIVNGHPVARTTTLEIAIRPAPAKAGAPAVTPPSAATTPSHDD